MVGSSLVDLVVLAEDGRTDDTIALDGYDERKLKHGSRLLSNIKSIMVEIIHHPVLLEASLHAKLGA